MNEYEQKQSNRRERLKARAEKFRRQTEQASNEAHKMAEIIPFGQPILVGHHSEGRDRRYRARIHNKMAASFSFEKQAEEAERKAQSVGSGGISSDDPEAVQKLKEKLAYLEAHQAFMKRVNSAHTAFLKNPASLEKSGLSEEYKGIVRTYKPRYPWEKHPFAPYELTNNNATIRQTKARIERLEAAAAEAVRVEAESGERAKVYKFEGFKVSEDYTENRVMVEFPGKPSSQTREILKRYGFRWSPSRLAWVRMLNSAGRWAASEIIEALTKKV